MNPPESLINKRNLDQLVKYAKSAPPGDFAEVGVYKGGSAWHLNEVCKEQGRTLHLFDTFWGIPFSCSKLDVHKRFEFSNVDFEEVVKAIPDAKFYKGIFPLSLPANLKDIAFVHVDCDQYVSTLMAILHFKDRLVKGGMLYFDDYGTLEGAKKAINEMWNPGIFDTQVERNKKIYIKK